MKENNQSKINYAVKAILFCAIFTLLLIALSFLKSMAPPQWERWLHGIGGTVAALLTTLLFLKAERKKFADIGFSFQRTTLKNFFTGLAIGIVLMGLLSGLVIVVSGFSIVANPKSSITGFLLLSAPLILMAYMEEVAFRGYPFVLLKEKFSLRQSILISTLLFALYHIANGWSLQTSLFGPGSWGILFAITAIHAKGISMPSGMHYGVNLTTAAFGISDSSFNRWVLKQGNGESLENYQASPVETLIPQAAMLVFAILAMELYLRKKRYC